VPELISTDQRRVRLGLRHRLVVPDASTPEEAADSVVALHATDPATIYLSIQARSAGATVELIDDALFERRSMIRTLAMRRTLFVPTWSMVAAIEQSSSPAVAKIERRQLLKFLTNSEIADPERWLSQAFAEVLEALDGVGMQARDVTNAVPRVATRIVLGGGKFTQQAKATSRVLGLMAVEGLLARGRPAGAWTNRQYVWYRRDQWLPLDPTFDDEAAASAALVNHYLRQFGPVTLTDVVWWTGWTKTKTRAALAEAGAVEVEITGEAGENEAFLSRDDAGEAADPGPWVALLPSLDPTPMGWKQRAWYVGDFTDELFDRNGNIGPTIWADGRIVGVWVQNSNGEIVHHLFESLSTTSQELLEAETSRLAVFLGETIVKPSFPTPRQKQLSSESP
jgi:hypothetical protein